MDPDALSEVQTKLQDALALLNSRGSMGAGTQDQLRLILQDVLDELSTGDQSQEGSEAESLPPMNDRMNSAIRQMGRG